MRSLILQFPMRRCLRQSWRWALAAILIWAMPGCTGHDNPFDSENRKTHDAPFNLHAGRYFGRIDLIWNRLPANLKIDDYQIHRRGGSRGDTLFFRADTFLNDAAIESKTVYNYTVSARRGREASDPSTVVETQAFWYPKRLKQLDAYEIFPNPVDLAFCPVSNRRYVVCEDRDIVVVLDEQDRKVNNAISVGSSPKGIACWHNDRTGLDTLLVCNYGSSSLSVIAEESKNNFRNIQTIPFAGRPLSVQISNALRIGYISFGEREGIIKFDLNKLASDGILLVNGGLRRLFLVGESGPLLGISQNENKVAIIDVNSGAVKYSESVEAIPSDLAIVSGSNLAYIACHYSLGYRDSVRISVINLATGMRVREREIVIRKDEWEENHPTSVAIVPGGLDDGLLFVAVWSIRLGLQATRIFGYHIGPQARNLIAVREISEAMPQLIRRPPNPAEQKLYILHSRGLHTDF